MSLFNTSNSVIIDNREISNNLATILGKELEFIDDNKPNSSRSNIESTINEQTPKFGVDEVDMGIGRSPIILMSNGPFPQNFQDSDTESSSKSSESGDNARKDSSNGSDDNTERERRSDKNENALKNTISVEDDNAQKDNGCDTGENAQKDSGSNTGDNAHMESDTSTSDNMQKDSGKNDNVQKDSGSDRDEETKHDIDTGVHDYRVENIGFKELDANVSHCPTLFTQESVEPNVDKMC